MNGYWLILLMGYFLLHISLWFCSHVFVRWKMVVELFSSVIPRASYMLLIHITIEFDSMQNYFAVNDVSMVMCIYDMHWVWDAIRCYGMSFILGCIWCIVKKASG